MVRRDSSYSRAGALHRRLLLGQKTNKDMLEMIVAAERRGEVLNRGAHAFRYKLSAMMNSLLVGHTIGRKFEAPLLTGSWFINYGLLLAFAEVIRIKCGHGAGLLSVLLRPVQNLDPQAPKSEPVLSYAEAMAQRMEQAQAAADAQAQHYASNHLPVDPKFVDPEYHFHLLSKSAQTYSDQLDPTMVVEGFAWWAQNLTVPDSTFILPALLGSVMVGGMLFQQDGRKYTIKTPESRKIETRGEETPSSSLTSSTSLRPTNSRTPTSSQTIGLLEREAQRDLQTRQINAAFAAAEKLRAESKTRIAPHDRSLFQNWTRRQRFGLCMAGLMFYLSAHWPIGILLYLIPNMIVGHLHTRWLNLKYPVPTNVEPCKRPMRIKV
ncbi:hypothetical protein BST61_g4184 [Cercospora zeina]